MHSATRFFLMAALLSVGSYPAAYAVGPLGLCCQRGCSSSACCNSPCAAPDCGCDIDYGCGCDIEPVCGCDIVPGCGCEIEPGCGCCEQPVCGCDILPGCCEQPTCGCDIEPGCGCCEQPTCGCDFEPGCGCCEQPTCGCDYGCDYSPACDRFACGSCCAPVRYCTVFGGWNKLQDYEGSVANNAFRGTFNDGWLFGVAAGRRVRQELRSELEFALRTNTGNSGSLNGAQSFLSGHAYTWTAMSNIYYDYHNCKLCGITPYAGVGIGLAILDGRFTTSVANLKTESTAFAFQTMLGASKHLSRSAELFGEYRYLGTTNITVKTVNVNPAVEFDGENINNHGLVFGIRIFK